MSDSEEYIPLSERLQQDVWHDNFVPKYSALASAKPSKLVLIGVWLIFAPMALLSLIPPVLWILSGATDEERAIVLILVFMLASVILYAQTKRYRIAKLHPDTEDEDTGP
ncbi:hypothetical protein Poly24_45960 [Rosistilla carotiformis]|uniref:Uncharacterized protein n=1 Tax=Rosistilla carotiformis TaxID=2528017 RepID=A0A518JZ93_9BACT|nr:hypothetical protein [Rosistilla carotiformis]QDV70863.1 hypothetical protein Poly24_45960 [Rosistilla carotiformis]